MVKDLKLTKENLTKLIDWPTSSYRNRLNKDEVIDSIMRRIDNHEIGMYVYNPDMIDVVHSDKWYWSLSIDENNATIYRSSNMDNMNGEITEYNLRQYNEYFLMNNEVEINSKLADVILEGEFSWAADIDNAIVYSEDDKLFLSVEKDDQTEVVELKDGKIYTDESFKYLSSEEVGELFSFLRFNSRESKYSYESGINLSYLHEDYLIQPFNDVSELFDQIADESLENRTIIFDNISKNMTNGQVYQILEGVRDGLNVSVYADVAYDYKQMHQIRTGMLNELPYSLYSDPIIEKDKMRVIREALQGGVPVGVVADIVEKKEYSTMSIIELDAAMNNALDYNIDDLEYYIYDRYDSSNTVTDTGFFLQRYEDAIAKWHDLGDVKKSLAIYNADIHTKEDNALVIMDTLNGKERLSLTQAYKETLGIDGLNESPAKSLIESIESRLIDDFKLDINSVHRERPIKEINKIKLSSMQEITTSLEQGVKEIFESGKYQSYLDTMARFHAYSHNNQILIHLQNPDATLVRGYGDGKNAKGGWFDLGRQVKKSEKAIKILAPMFVSEKYKGELLKKIMSNLKKKGSYTLPNTNLSIRKNKDNTYSVALNGSISNMRFTSNQLSQYLDKKAIGKMICGFKPVNVFDISQCVIRKIKDKEGNLNNDPRADNAVFSLSGKIDNTNPEKMNFLFDLLKSISDKNSIPMDIEAMSGKSGYYNLIDKRIAVSDSINESHKVKTAIHEMAHSRLHNDIASPDSGIKDLRGEMEVQAESIAYVVSKELGLDASDYSFGYIAAWSEGKELNELKKSMDIISKESKKLINDIDKELKTRNLDRTVLTSKESTNTMDNTIDFSQQYKEDPFQAFESMRNNDKHDYASKLSNNDIQYIINSKYIKERYNSSVKHTPDKFINKSFEQLEKAKAVAGSDGEPFVEISFCENVFSEPVFEDGEILNIKDADMLYKKTERNIQSEKLKDNNFPDMTCYASIYVPVYQNNKKSLAVIHTKTNIGDGLQTGLVDALKSSDKLMELDTGIKNQILQEIDKCYINTDKEKGIENVKNKVNEYRKTSMEVNNVTSNQKPKSKEEVII